MSWILLSILATIIWAVLSIIDKYVLTKWVKNPLALVIIFSLISLLIGTGIYLIVGFSFLATKYIILALVAGFAYTLLGSFFYYKAVKADEVSRVIPLFNFGPLFVMFLAAIFLAERLSWFNYLGVIILIFGALFISWKPKTPYRINKAFVFSMVTNLAYATEAIVAKYLLQFTDFWTVFGYLKIGSFLGCLPIFYLAYKEFKIVINQFGYRPVIFITINETLSEVSFFIVTFAYTLGSVTLINALTATQSFFVLAFAVIFSLFFPRILKEEVKPKTVLLKLVAIILMFIGVILIT